MALPYEPSESGIKERTKSKRHTVRHPLTEITQGAKGTSHVLQGSCNNIQGSSIQPLHTILPVVPNGSRQDVVHAAINSSYLWNHCTVMKLTVNMRLGSGSNSSERKEIQDFADWILNIRNGKIGGKNDGEANVEFPDYIAILAPTHELVDMINDRMLSLIHGDEKTYNSSDTVGVADVNTNFNETMYTEKFLNNLNMAGIPHHSIKLKIGTPVMCMRNIDQRAELCNGTRLQVLRMGTNVIEAKIISGGSVGTVCAIPRMVISPSNTKLPFKLNRRQFPVQICFGMTINKSQGQMLSKVGLFLQRPVFSHGQLYVVVLRVKTKKGLKVLCCDKDVETLSAVLIFELFSTKPLATKPPTIVDWKIHKEGKKSLYQIIRADGSSKMYKVFSLMLKSFDREDLETLYKLVKAKYGLTRSVEDLDLILYGDLKTMFEPHVEDQIWKNLDNYSVLDWKLYDSYGVHSLRKQNVYIHMLVEKRYPLTHAIIIDMLNRKLEADHWNEMCYHLLKLITKQFKNQ
ncbi:ATP-dependent DNA helicase PIF1-like protein [Tanacetum coccineum]